MDSSLLQIAGINVLVFVPGLVQFVKVAANLADRAAEVLTVVVGILCVGCAYALNSGMIPGAATPYIELAFTAVAGGLAIAGYYKLVSAAGRSFAATVRGLPAKHRFD